MRTVSQTFVAFDGRFLQKKKFFFADTDSLFAAVEDFSEMLEETGKSKTHGTLGDIFNKDKASEKQLSWEQKRFKSHDYSSKKNNNRKFGSKTKSGNKKKF